MNRKFWIAVGGMGVGLVLLLFGGWHFLLQPIDHALVEKETEKTALEQKLAVAKQRAAQFERFQAESENVRRALDFYGARVDSTMNQQEIYSLCYGLANSLNLRDTKIEISPRIPSKIKGVGTLDQVDVKFTFKSDMETFGRFVNSALSSRRLILPEKVTLKGVADSEGRYHETLEAIVEMAVLLGKGGK